MSMTLEDGKDLGWKQICQDDVTCCIHPLDHSHDFELGKEISKLCCDAQMRSAQIYENEFGKNNSMLRNSYTCEICGKIEGIELYQGVPKSYRNIYLEAKAKVEHLSLSS